MDTRWNPGSPGAAQPLSRIETGKPYPLGSFLDTRGCNFSVHAPFAQSVELCLFDACERLTHRFSLPAKSGNTWHGYLPGIRCGQYYGYRLFGVYDAEHGLYHDHNKLLIDPYARRLSRPLIWDYQQYKADSQAMIPKSVVVDPQTFDWQDITKPEHDKEQLIIYEAHVRGMTMQCQQLPAELRGTYLGMAHPFIIDHLKQLGISAVQLMPIMSFMSEPWLQERGLSNYWGYNPVSFFSPDARYAVEDPYNECKLLIRELHRAGIEVLLDVVYNHTAEGGDGGPVLSLKGFNNRGIYRFVHDEQQQADYTAYINDTGCGNCLNLDNPQTLRLVLESMRFWLEEMQVDGFRFDLAVTLAREAHGFNGNGGFFKAIYQDPVLSRAKLIAEPWDIGLGGYQVGQFPAPWLELNDRFRDTMRAFWKGDQDQIGNFATRFLGSRDFFPIGIRPHFTSVNFITYHDGFTLVDLVSYNERHNEDNGEHNRDGHSHNISWNHGHEGETDDPGIQALRERQRRNMLATTVLAYGTPHVLGGDELGRTQRGNNNAYCQDNSQSWYDWALTSGQQDFLQFCQRLFAIRHDSELLRNSVLGSDSYFKGAPIHVVTWWREDGHVMKKSDWLQVHRHLLGLELTAKKGHNGMPPEHLLLIFNAATKDISFHLPQLSPGRHWRLLLDTWYPVAQDPAPQKVANYRIHNRSLAVLAGHL